MQSHFYLFPSLPCTESWEEKERGYLFQKEFLTNVNHTMDFLSFENFQYKRMCYYFRNYGEVALLLQPLSKQNKLMQLNVSYEIEDVRVFAFEFISDSMLPVMTII